MADQEPRPDQPGEVYLDLRRLKWIAVFAPLVFLVIVELIRKVLAPGFFGAWPGYLLLAGIVLLGTMFFAEFVFGIIERMRERLIQQTQELLALHEAGLAVTSALDLERVLQNVVEEARELVGARYGAFALLREEGGMEAFLTSGISAEQRARLGPIPAGHGLLGVVINDATPLRLPNLIADPRSVGFPPGHPEMRSLVAVPVLSHGQVLGSLYLTEKAGAAEFDAADQARLERFATQAALAIENARLHQQVRAMAVAEERERIAREMHDSIAQVLGYVNTKAQAAQEFLRAGQSDRAETQIGQLSQAAREAYADVRESIMGLRMALGSEEDFVSTLIAYLERYQDQSGVVTDLTCVPEDGLRLDVSPLAELQLLRIIQEALTNIRKHAGASRASVRLENTGASVVATITDNGRGFDRESTVRPGFPQFGLSTMHERAEAVGGTVEIESSPGSGTTVRAIIPLTGSLTSYGGESHARSHR